MWEIKQKTIIDMAADRGAFICHRLNIHISDPNFGKLTSMHFYVWKKGLKTGMYYLRTKSASDAVKFTVKEVEKQAEAVLKLVDVSKEQNAKDMSCSLDNPEGCEACGN